jgi:hypothetical protein
MLKLGEDYTPQMSDYITVKVLSVCKNTCQLNLKIIGKSWVWIGCHHSTYIKLVKLQVLKKMCNVCLFLYDFLVNAEDVSLSFTEVPYT